MAKNVNSMLEGGLFAKTLAYAELNKAPLGFVDVGARGGVHPLAEPLARLVAVLGFEPDEKECERLTTLLSTESPWAEWVIEPAALGSSEGAATLHRLAGPHNDSLLPPNRPLVDRFGISSFKSAGTRAVRTTTLDTILFGKWKGRSNWGEFLKVDTQGTELHVLEGAERTLRERTVAVLAETCFCRLYEGQPLFSEVEAHLRKRGFSFYGFVASHYRSKKLLDRRIGATRERLINADAVFLKDPLPGSENARPLSTRQTYALFSSAMLLGYFDFALELALETWATGDEAKRIRAWVARQSARLPEDSRRGAVALTKQIRNDPASANLAVGRFVAEFGAFGTYEDILQSSAGSSRPSRQPSKNRPRTPTRFP
jgi:FkbM family methyltransferase